MKQVTAVAVFALGVFCSSASADPITVDTHCNPAVDTPAAGGCTWNNFYESIDTGAPFGTGSSYANYYVAAGTDPWTIDNTSGYFTLRVLDGGHQGDTFDVYDDGVLLGTTSPTTVDITHTCANDPTDSVPGVSPGSDPSSCWKDPLLSQGTFNLNPNPAGHSIEILWDQKITGGDSSLQWFEVNTALAPQGAPAVPEPTTLAMAGFALLGLFLVRRTRRSSRA